MVKKRNIGIELIRIFSMYMIMVLHIMLNGGVLFGSRHQFLNHQIAWFIECFCIMAVNLFGMISGYVLVNSKLKLTRVLSLWQQVFTYSAALGILGFILLHTSKLTLIKSFLPLTMRQYWYFSAYVVLCFFIPILNPWIRSLHQITYLRILTIVTLFFSVYGIFTRYDGLFLKGGYSPIWLGILYLFGGYFRRFGFPKFKASLGWLIILATIVINVLIVDIPIFGYQRLQGFVLQYNNPLNLLSAVVLFILVARHNYQFSVISSIASHCGKLVFAAYLLQTSPTVFAAMEGAFANLGNLSALVMILSIFLIAFLFLFLAIIVEYLRQKLMMLCHEESLIKWIERILYRCENIVNTKLFGTHTNAD